MPFCQAGGPQLNGYAHHCSSAPAGQKPEVNPSQLATIHRGSSLQIASTDRAGTSQASDRPWAASNVPPEVCSTCRKLAIRYEKVMSSSRYIVQRMYR